MSTSYKMVIIAAMFTLIVSACTGGIWRRHHISGDHHNHYYSEPDHLNSHQEQDINENGMNNNAADNRRPGI